MYETSKTKMGQTIIPAGATFLAEVAHHITQTTNARTSDSTHKQLKPINTIQFTLKLRNICANIGES